MRCLKIDEPWISLIINRVKTWEIRRQRTNIRERIGLGSTETKCCVGYANLVDCKPFSLQELKGYNDKHHANDFLDSYAKGEKILYAWVLDDVKKVLNPKPWFNFFTTNKQAIKSN
jgi:hypothetical protein